MLHLLIIAALPFLFRAARRAEFDQRVAKARRWLAETKPELDYEQTFQLLGLVWTGASPSEINHAVASVKKLQRKDGGWGQTANLASDAFATGSALYALQLAGVPASEAGSKRAVGYLLSTQLPDGSWHVASRGPKLQPYFQSGFPHDHDQWISAAGTSWAVAALSNTMPKASKVAAMR